MNLSRMTILVCLSLSACKTSHFKGNATTSEVPVDEPTGVTTTVPTVTTSTANVPVTSTPIETTTTDLQLNQSCEKPVQLLMTQIKLSFPKTDNCKFKEEPNLVRLEGHVQAREFQSMPMKLPESSEICSMTIESPMAQTKYDDFLILTIDDFIIFASNKMLVTPLTLTNNLYKWDFLKVRGLKVDFNDGPYCIGAAERCKFPATDTEGAVLMKLNYNEIVGIAKAIQGKVQVPVDLIATGDNDDGDVDPVAGGVEGKFDCSHEKLDLTISLNYIKKPK